MTTDTPLTGGCLCGGVRFRLEATPIITHCCHCRFCQQASGTAFCSYTMIETERLTLLQGQPQACTGLSTRTEMQCPDCHCAVWIHRQDLGDVIALVGIGMLDHGDQLPPEAHYYTRSKLPWITLPPGIPAFETIGDPGKAGAGERIMAALAKAGRQISFPR